ncbi:hypothetical protein MSAN_00097000 [Mycena sanguinolenta]|uniref:F-box domain-containing protein n=1 Tax=Mycena sanguinolenta TaxID=230812 RepID=A0A8H7DMN5_9AGAR|nr:hypothetical protein MSAN_00097000 [Mycena sanguinolenta]
MSTKEAPLLLCRICSAWRRIALSAPRLWASLHAPLDFILLKESRISAVAQWLQRSAACPISISVRDGSSWDWESQGLPATAKKDLTKSICAVANRWCHMKFDSMPIEMAHELRGIKPSLLESVEFSGNIPTPTDLQFLQVPSLRAVTLHLYDFEPFNAAFTIPLMWNRLQHLTITGISFSQLIMLGQCQELISLTITPFIDSVPDPFPTGLILPSLASFRIVGTSILPDFLVQLTSHVSVPELRRLAVQAGTCQYGPQHSFFLVSLGKKSPLVEDLTIYLPSLTAQSLPETLRAFSLARLVVYAIETLTWDKDGFQSCTVTLLLTVLSDSATCPMLQELVIHDSSSLDHSKSTLDGFVRQRMECAHPLRRLEISFEGLWTESQVDLMSESEIRSYRLQGLDISLRCENTAPCVANPPDPWTGLWLEDI